VADGSEPAASALPITWLGVCGWPVRHSRSPHMHNAALAAAGLSRWRYLRLPLPPDLFAETVCALPGRGFAGVNVTIPHKEAALALADEATPTASAVGAANTLTFRSDGTIEADNTDAPGLLAALPPHQPPAGRRALVLGAGGSGRAVVHALVQAGAEVSVWNRTPERARELAAQMGATAVRDAVEADIVVNCTSVGLNGDPEEVKTLPLRADHLRAGSCLVDLVYRDGGTPLLAAARGWGVDTVDGLEVLIAQGAASFERWTGRPAARDEMRAALQIPRA
jgi:shikimate dehydrogenase